MSQVPTIQRIGHAELDAQHLDLFARIEALTAAQERGDHREILLRFADLAGSVEVHFEVEARLMERLADRLDPALLARSQEAHGCFLRDFGCLVQRMHRTGPTPGLALQVKGWLTTTLREYVAGVDLELALALAAAPPVASASPRAA